MAIKQQSCLDGCPQQVDLFRCKFGVERATGKQTPPSFSLVKISPDLFKEAEESRANSTEMS